MCLKRYIEREHGSPYNNATAVGKYTQMVWAATHKVGCGITKCHGRYSPRGKPFYHYVCNYCPTGFEDSIGVLYKSGQPCSSCPNSFRSDKIRTWCTNTRNAADQLSNCKELYRDWSTWLCKTKTIEGLKRRKSCMATCTCRGKICD